MILIYIPDFLYFEYFSWLSKIISTEIYREIHTNSMLTYSMSCNRKTSQKLASITSSTLTIFF